MIKTYNIEGLSCAACAVSSQKILSKIEGIENVRVNYATARAVLEFEKDIDLEILNGKLQKAGFKLVSKDNKSALIQKDNEHKKFIKLERSLILAAVFAIPLFVVSIFLHGVIADQTANYIMLFLSLPIMLVSGRRFFISAWNQLLIFQSNMDTLVALGTGTAFVFSLFNTFFPDYLKNQGFQPHVYYETAGILIAFILLGKYFEERAKKKTSKAIEALLGLKVPKVTVLLDGKELIMPVEAVMIDDVILVKPGDKIPLDALIQKGDSEIDEAMLSGEPLPKYRKSGDNVFAGTLNISGLLELKVTKTSENTLLSQLVKLVEEAQSSEAPVQKLVDKISAVFVPSVLVIAILSAAIWWFFGPEPQFTHALIAAVTVLVIACPCALGLATPTAIMVGIGRAASKGILIKGAESLLAAEQINAIVFDKTGTLTEGKPKVDRDYWAISEKDNYCKILATMTRNSEHPLSKAVYEHIYDEGYNAEMSDFVSVSGRGIKAQKLGISFFVGNELWLSENKIRLSEAEKNESESMKTEGKTLVFFADETKLLAVFGLSDQIKENAAETVKKLKAKGFEIYLLTGDHHAAGKIVAESIGIDNLKAEVLPQDKIDFVKELQSNGRKVAMVGDGINDAPALAQSNLGIAMNSGTDIAIESADMVLLHNNPLQVISAINISKNTMGILKQNLFWAFFYNVLGIPIAAGVLYPFWGILLDPMIAGAAMAFSSVSVVLNSLRIKDN